MTNLLAGLDSITAVTTCLAAIASAVALVSVSRARVAGPLGHRIHVAYVVMFLIGTIWGAAAAAAIFGLTRGRPFFHFLEQLLSIAFAIALVVVLSLILANNKRKRYPV